MIQKEWLNVHEVINLVGLGRTSIYTLIGRRQFPRPIQMGPKSVKWRLKDIEAWMRQKIYERLC
ncbi:helix-turn-helix transcriptional regulator [Vibrio gigantis]|uniref:helix-turn-helix transcriptional regulator n=1 Tax=Vibrio gigantis TaxID=296199 RepID=UPI001BFEE8E2